jgi:hypothetical protein
MEDHHIGTMHEMIAAPVVNPGTVDAALQWRGLFLDLLLFATLNDEIIIFVIIISVIHPFLITQSVVIYLNVAAILAVIVPNDCGILIFLSNDGWLVRFVNVNDGAASHL